MGWYVHSVAAVDAGQGRVEEWRHGESVGCRCGMGGTPRMNHRPTMLIGAVAEESRERGGGPCAGCSLSLPMDELRSVVADPAARDGMNMERMNVR